MLMTFVALYTIYIVIKIYVSVMQVGFVKNAKNKQAVLMSTADFRAAADYAVAKERYSIVGSFVEYIIFLFWVGGGIAFLDSFVFTDSHALNSVLIVLSFLLINSILGLPMELYEKFVLDEKFGFNRSSLGLYVRDTLITMLLTLIIGGVVVYGVYLIIDGSTLWWLWSFLFIFAVIVLVNILFPTVRALFFDKITLLDDDELNAQIKTLMDKTGFMSSGVYVSDASKRDARLNAYFAGLGKSKRVVLFDTLLEKLTKNELLAVLGHELGHFSHGDIYKNIAMMGVMLFSMFAIFGNIPSSLYLELGISQSPHAIMILFMLSMSVLGFIMMPIMGLVSRHNEFEADRMGAQLGGAKNLTSALKKLVSENKSFPLSHPIYMFFYHTHPPVLERIKMMGEDIYADFDDALEGSCPTV